MENEMEKYAVFDESNIRELFAGNPQPLVMPEIVIYEHIKFQGASWRTNLAYPQLGRWDKHVSSIIVVSGVWELYADTFFSKASYRFFPGYYPTMPPNWNDATRSLRPVALR